MNKARFVAYLIAPKKVSKHQLSPRVALESQNNQIRTFLKHHEPAELLETFVEVSDHKRNHHSWDELKKAVDYCIKNHAHLVISEIKNLTSNEEFVHCIQPLLNLNTTESIENFKPEIHCCDQPIVHLNNFTTLVEHALQQKKMHGALIKAGLSRTSAKSGNPHAAEVINRVNKPKIENAIIFSLLLQPVIAAYTAKSFSQRKMVSMLNEEGFTAPEGGKWVLSQFQKVLDRMKLCEAALSLEKRFIQYKEQSFTTEQMIEHLNKMNIPAPKGKTWDADQIQRVQEKIKEIHDVLVLNELAVELLPILNHYHFDELSEEILLKELKQAGVQIPETLRSKAA